MSLADLEAQVEYLKAEVGAASALRTRASLTQTQRAQGEIGALVELLGEIGREPGVAATRANQALAAYTEIRQARN